MKKMVVFSLYFFLALSLQAKQPSSFLTYEKPKGRLGDQLFCICKAEWLCYQYGLELRYKFVEGMQDLSFFNGAQIFQQSEFKDFQQKRLMGYHKTEKNVMVDSAFDDSNTLYIIDECFYPMGMKSIMSDMQHNVIYPYNILYDKTFVEKGYNNPPSRHDEMLKVFKKDKKFVKHIQNFLKPLREIKKIEKPQEYISVAVHVRKGGGFDTPCQSIQHYKTSVETHRYLNYIKNGVDSFTSILSALRIKNCHVSTEKISFRTEKIDVVFPLKLPPEQFYIDQLKALSEMMNNKPLYVYIFTDDKNPLDIVGRFSAAVNKDNIKFACRTTENNYYSNVLDDLFGMSMFDCLIRPYSSLSQVAELIGNHKIVLSPRHGIWQGDKLIIDEVLVTIYDKNVVC